MGEQYLSANDICAKFSIGRTTFYRLLRNDETFPRHVMVCGMRRWKLSEIEAWQERQEALAT